MKDTDSMRKPTPVAKAPAGADNRQPGTPIVQDAPRVLEGEIVAAPTDFAGHDGALVAPDESTALDLPDYLRGLQAPNTKDNFDNDDIVLPSIKLLQGSSEQVSNFDNARAGEFWHTGMDMPLGRSLRFIVCARRKKYLLQAPMDDGQGVLARADDAVTWDRLGKWEVKVDKKTKVTWEIKNLSVAGSGLTEWGTYDPSDENSPPAATLFYEYLVILPDHLDMGPGVITLARSAIRKAKKGLNDKIALHQSNGRPMQAIVFEARVTVEKNDTGQDFYNWMFTGAGFASEDNYLKARNGATLLETRRTEDLIPDEPTGRGASGPAGGTGAADIDAPY